MRITEGRGVSVEISFHELSKELQTKVYRSNRDKMEKIASESNHFELRMEVAEYATSHEFLRDMLFKEIENEDVRQVIFEILDNKNFEIDDEIRKKLIESNCFEVRRCVAKDSETSTDILNNMLYEELKSHADPDVIIAIVNNNNFEMDNDFREMLAASDSWKVRLIVAQDNDTPTTWLNEMLCNEIERDCEDGEVTETIINNANFVVDCDNIETYAKSKNPNVRIFAAECKDASCDFLKSMLYDELNGEENQKVIEAILYNDTFQSSLTY